MDEIHRLNRQVEEVLYPAMEDYAIDIMIEREQVHPSDWIFRSLHWWSNNSCRHAGRHRSETDLGDFTDWSFIQLKNLRELLPGQQRFLM